MRIWIMRIKPDGSAEANFGLCISPGVHQSAGETVVSCRVGRGECDRLAEGGFGVTQVDVRPETS